MIRLLALVLFLLAGVSNAAAAERVVAYQITNGREILEPLAGVEGDPERGRKLYFDRRLTGCSGCHGSPGGPGAEADQSASNAPSLRGIASRASTGTLRLWLVAPQVLNPDTAMPAFYTVGQRTDPNDPRYGEPILTAEEIEHLVAYLGRQK